MSRRDSRPFSTWATGLALITAPFFLLASAIVSPPLTTDESAQLAVVSQYRDRYYEFSILIFIGSVLFIPAVLGLWSLAASRRPRLANVGVSLALVGSVIAVGDAMTGLFVWEMAAPVADRAQMVALLTRFDNAAGIAILFRIGGPSMVVGMVLLGVALFRARAVPAWSAAGLALGTFLNILGFVIASAVVVAVSSAILLVALGWIGLAVLGVPRFGSSGWRALEYSK